MNATRSRPSRAALAWLTPLAAAAFLAGATPCFADTTLVFNEIMYHPAADEANLEWIELHSQLAVDLDISGWSLGGGIRFTFPRGTVVRGGGFIVVAISPAALARATGYQGALGPFTGRLANEGERLELRNNSGRLMDSVEYADEGDWPVGADGAGVSLAKRDPDAASAPPENWRTSHQPGGTPGAPNFGGPPGRQTLLPIDAEWRYDASGRDPGTAWRTAAFDAAAWAAARGVFYRSDAVVPATTWTGQSNRTSPQDFGFSATTNYAGGDAPGELGGHIERSPAAWYADASIGAIDLRTHDLSASVTWLQEGNGNITFGYFQADSYGPERDPYGLYWQIDDLKLYLVVRQPGESPVEVLVGSLTAGMRATIGMRWAAAARTWTVTLDGSASESSVVANALGDVRLDRFGVLSLGQGGGYGVRFWADDIEYTVAAPVVAQRVQTFGGGGPPPAARTELPDGPTTYYFRTTFALDDNPQSREVLLQTIARDGFVAYINGAEVMRHNLPAGAVDASTYALSDADPFASSPPVVLDSRQLIAGTNVLAVEVHRSSDADRSVAFAASIVMPTGPPRDARPALRINELSGAGGSLWIELLNTSDVPIELAGHVLVLAGDTSGEYVLPVQTLPNGAHVLVDAATTGFAAAAGDRLFLFAPRRTSLLDAAVVQPSARARDEAGRWLVPSAQTPGNANVFALQEAVVINEVMYHQRPVFDRAANASVGESPEAWIELYNRGTEPVDLSGWTLQDAVEFAFEPGMQLPPGEYLVVAKDRAHLQQMYPSLRIAGEFTRNLSHRSDRIRLLDARGNPADEVRYYDGGSWHALADGGGASLELRDARADNARPEAWASSDESHKARWTAYSYRGVAGPIVSGAPAEPYELQIGLLDGPGELLIDDISVVREPGGAAIELVPNGGFDGGDTTGWRFTGTHEHSTVIVDPDEPGNHVLRVVGAGPTEPVFNHIAAELTAAAPDGVEYAISFRARWVAGSRQLNTRLYFNRLAKTTLLAVPERSGTPGTENSRRAGNIGPTFDGLRHVPVTPLPGEPVMVAVRAADPDGVAGATLWWAAGEGAWRRAPMRQAGGEYVASIPGQPAASVVQFYVEATDTRGARGFSPPDGPASRALYAVDDGQAAAGRVPVFRTIMLPSEAAEMHGRARRSNERRRGTVVWKESQPYYDVGIRLRGSLVQGRDSPSVGHSIEFQPDRLFRGVHPTVAIDRDAKGAVSVREIVLLHAIAAAGGIPAMYNDIVQAVAPLPEHTSRAMLRMAAQNDVFLDSQYEDGSDGTVYESEGIRAEPYVYVDFMDLGDDKESYRWNFVIQNNRRRDDYRGLIALAKTLGMPAGPELEARAAAVMDVSEWMRVFAMQALGAVSDTYLQDGNHNLRVYARPADGRMLAFPWDLDGAFSYSPFPWGQGNLTKVIERVPYTRMYYGHLHDLVTSVYNVEYLSPWVRHYGELADEDLRGVLDVIASRAAAARDVLPPQVPFAASASLQSSNLRIDGTGWIDIEAIRVAGTNAPLAVTWTSLQDWHVTIPIDPSRREVVLEAVGYRGENAGRVAVDLESLR